MTVLAIFHDLGLAFSDVMLSTDKPGEHLSLPSTGHTRNLKTKLPLSPTRLVRKFFRVSHQGKTGMFLVAGTVTHIKQLVLNVKRVKDHSRQLPEKYISHLCLNEATSVIHVACVMTEDEGYAEFEIVGVINGVTFSRLCNENRALDCAPYFGITRMAGSGAADLHRWVCERGTQYVERELVHDTLEVKTDRSINMIPSLLLEEDTRSTLTTISKGVGGYYESYYFGQETIEPLNSVLTVFAAIKGKGGQSFLELRRVFYHSYVADWLLVISLINLPVQLYPGSDKVFPFEHFELFKIPPLLEEGNEPNWTVSRLAIEMNSAENFRLTLYREEEVEEKISKRFSEGADGRRLLSVKVVNKSVVLSINQDNFLYYTDRFRSNLPANKVITLVMSNSEQHFPT